MYSTRERLKFLQWSDTGLSLTREAFSTKEFLWILRASFNICVNVYVIHSAWACVKSREKSNKSIQRGYILNSYTDIYKAYAILLRRPMRGKYYTEELSPLCDLKANSKEIKLWDACYMHPPSRHNTCTTALESNICLIDRIISCAPLNSQFCLIILESTSCCYMYKYSIQTFCILILHPLWSMKGKFINFTIWRALQGCRSMDKNNNTWYYARFLQYTIQYTILLWFPQVNIEWSGIMTYTDRWNYTAHEVFHGGCFWTNTSGYNFLRLMCR